MKADTNALGNVVIAFIGGGQMATALIAGLRRSGRSADSILVVEPDAQQRSRLGERFGVQVFPSSTQELARAGAVVWAVKPQVMEEAAKPVRDIVRSALHISIVAGIATPLLQEWLQTDRVIRVMPNTPALVGEGVTGMFAGPGAAPADRELAHRIFAVTGHTFWVDADDRIDAVTAVSGSGPGYVFQFLASFQAAAQALGFSEEQARDLVLRTCAGAVQQACAETTALTTLRDRVASKGGTTEAGLNVLTRYELPRAMTEAVGSAFARARELSNRQAAKPV
ncbi:pyrroline-5-carboxylate reductase [Hydrogenophaga sp. 2FB]|uniref:pyrroline-5-carboxylate reductase n=1 Tax=Hydrogenophaga sp. 2FB TaxID=2502187 RepID=UPI0010F542AA|nr:pyrroline-5-carboxylate reductase [Hydrogenophaga sp. 2FB]